MSILNNIPIRIPFFSYLLSDSYQSFDFSSMTMSEDVHSFLSSAHHGHDERAAAEVLRGVKDVGIGRPAVISMGNERV